MQKEKQEKQKREQEELLAKEREERSKNYVVNAAKKLKELRKETKLRFIIHIKIFYILFQINFNYLF